MKRKRDYSWGFLLAAHGKCLAAACLAITDDAGVPAAKGFPDMSLAHLVKNTLGGGVRWVYFVKSEFLVTAH